MDNKKIKSVIGDDSDLICIECKKEKKMRMSAYCKNCKLIFGGLVSLNEKLKQAAEAWAIARDYKRAAMPEVLALNKEYRAAYPDKYPYNADILKFITARAGVAAEYEDMLGTEVYLSQHDIENEAKDANKARMIAAGWKPLDKAAVDEAITAGKQLQVSATADNDWMRVKINSVYKPHIFAQGTDREQYGLMKPRGRTHGYALYQFDNAFCKLI